MIRALAVWRERMTMSMKQTRTVLCIAFVTILASSSTTWDGPTMARPEPAAAAATRSGSTGPCPWPTQRPPCHFMIGHLSGKILARPVAWSATRLTNTVLPVQICQDHEMTDLLHEACSQLDVAPARALVQGGQKQVHVVTHLDGNESVLKLIDLGLAADPAALERARREVDLLKSIDHPNVVAVSSDLQLLGDPPVAVFWLEEFLDGTDLRYGGSGWPWEHLLALGGDVAAGLGALHKKKVIHRDLSPGNVQRLASGKFVVTDPGFAKHTLRSGLTVGGQPGTRGFMTPEHLQAYSGSPTAASDVFGCCALVYLAATGHPPVPYKGDDFEYLRRLRTAEHIPLRDARPDVPDGLVAVVERGLHPQPARRYRNGDALQRAFEEA
ncbi:serine/threonine protein kinase [Haloactinopolyspora alba]|uniref:non-specific serine/threonine protein kinase n=1 Tax=Haloactinopolyspora alba TaxID=648780 RepID=A0A2P8EF98_9ACTN|nr:serine/threonine-protein kinase [Haloactinopolyspora alba]PSL08149.1 serine/threonine protein kinase [Haloactinopolyspora alba]